MRCCNERSPRATLPSLTTHRSRRVEAQRDLRALLRYKKEADPFKSPDGGLIELHRMTGTDETVFPADATIGGARGHVQRGCLQSDAAPMLLAYLCYHNTEHLWSRLHWVADLDAVLADPDCDVAKARRIAADMGGDLHSRPALAFTTWPQSPQALTEVPCTNRSAQLLGACVANLGGAVELEGRSRSSCAVPAVPVVDGPQIPTLTTVETLRPNALAPGSRQLSRMAPAGLAAVDLRSRGV